MFETPDIKEAGTVQTHPPGCWKFVFITLGKRPLRLIDSPAAIILAHNTVLNLPRDLAEAACTPMGTFYRIVLPSCSPRARRGLRAVVHIRSRTRFSTRRSRLQLPARLILEGRLHVPHLYHTGRRGRALRVEIPHPWAYPRGDQGMKSDRFQPVWFLNDAPSRGLQGMQVHICRI